MMPMLRCAVFSRRANFADVKAGAMRALCRDAGHVIVPFVAYGRLVIVWAGFSDIEIWDCGGAGEDD